jgi:hypothetical protein
MARKSGHFGGFHADIPVRHVEADKTHVTSPKVPVKL